MKSIDDLKLIEKIQIVQNDLGLLLVSVQGMIEQLETEKLYEFYNEEVYEYFNDLDESFTSLKNEIKQIITKI